MTSEIPGVQPDAAEASGRQRPVRSSSRAESGLAGRSRRELIRLARRADRLRRADVVRFERLADDLDVQPRQLRLMADAWAEGGKSGIAALGPAERARDDVMDRAATVIETWRRRHYPMDALRLETWRNRVTVYWLRPGPDRTGALVEHPLMQLRRTEDCRWHLYRRAVQGEWWPVVVRGRRRRQSLSACLDAVRVDLLHHFWGEHGPPIDLADGDGLPHWPLD